MKILVQPLLKDKEEEKINFHQVAQIGDKSFTPNSSFTDTNKIKSFSFLRDNSHNNRVVSRFRIYSSISSSEEGEEQESSSSNYKILTRWKYNQRDFGRKTMNLNHKFDKDTVIVNRSVNSGGNVHKTTDTSPAWHQFGFNNLSNPDNKNYIADEHSKGIRKEKYFAINNNQTHLNSNKTLLINHSSSKLNMIIESQESAQNEEFKQIPGDAWEEIPEEDIPISENFTTTEISEFNTHNQIIPVVWRKVNEFKTNQNSSMFKIKKPMLKH